MADDTATIGTVGALGIDVVGNGGNAGTDAGAGAGTDTGAGGSGSATGTRRRRGRPAKPGTGAEAPSNAGSVVVEGLPFDGSSDTYKVTGAGRNKTGNTAAGIARNLAASLNMVAAFRGPHWRKSAQECMPLAEPVAAYLEELPVELRRNVEKLGSPLSVLMGLMIVFGEPIKYELEIAQTKRRLTPTVKPRNSGSPVQPGPVETVFSGSPVGSPNGASAAGDASYGRSFPAFATGPD